METYENIAKDTPATIGCIRTLIAEARKARPQPLDDKDMKDIKSAPQLTLQTSGAAASASAAGAGGAAAQPKSPLSPRNSAPLISSSVVPPPLSLPVAIPQRKEPETGSLKPASGAGAGVAASSSVPASSPAAGLALTVAATAPSTSTAASASAPASGSAPALNFVPKPPAGAAPPAPAASTPSSAAAPAVSVLLSSDVVQARVSVAEAEKRPDLDAADFTPWFAYTDPNTGNTLTHTRAAQAAQAVEAGGCGVGRRGGVFFFFLFYFFLFFCFFFLPPSFSGVCVCGGSAYRNRNQTKQVTRIM